MRARQVLGVPYADGLFGDGDLYTAVTPRYRCSKLARALLVIADQQEPPLRFVAGADAIEGVKAKAQELLAQAEASRELGGNLAYEDANA